jgi:hypothetical protein
MTQYLIIVHIWLHRHDPQLREGRGKVWTAYPPAGAVVFTEDKLFRLECNIADLFKAIVVEVLLRLSPR